MATGENVLWVVEKKRVNGNKTVGRIVFRTRQAATDWSMEKLKRGRAYWYTAPRRATWGPEQ